MAWRILIIFTAVAAVTGAMLAIPCNKMGAAPAGQGSAEMQYYLANQALFSGDTDAALEHVKAVVATGDDPGRLCPGVTFDLDMRGQRYGFCNPDAVHPPEGIATWLDAQAAEARRLEEAGDRAEATARLDQLLAVNPYDLEARATLAAWLQAAGEEGEAQVHQERLRAFREGRLLSIESVRGPNL